MDLSNIPSTVHTANVPCSVPVAELQDALPIAADMFNKALGKSGIESLKADDIYILRESTYCADVPNYRPTDQSKHRKRNIHTQYDRRIETRGTRHSSPQYYLSASRPYTQIRGLTSYRCKHDRSLVYIVYSSPSSDGNNYTFPRLFYILVPKGLLFRFLRYRSRCAKQSVDAVPPVLKEGLLEHISDSTIGFLSNATKMMEYNAKLKRGILLGGTPGNGKTMICRWLQYLCAQNNFSTDIVTSPMLEAAFKENRLGSTVSSAQIVFFDDIDLSFLSRGVEGDSRMACALASALDGFGEHSNLVRIFTTNEDAQMVDAAFKRPGRIDQWITIEPPTHALRQRFISTWHQDILNHIDIEELATQTEKFSFAQLEAIKSLLVDHKITTGKWDIDKALEEFAKFKPDDKTTRRQAGFISEVTHA